MIENQDAKDDGSECDDGQPDHGGENHGGFTVSPTGDDRGKSLGRRGLRVHRKRRWVLIGSLGVIALSAFLFFPLDYLVDAPGSVTATGDRVRVQGATTYEDGGAISFLTVSQTQATPALLVRAWIDDAEEVLSKREVYGDNTPQQDKIRNRDAMDDSKSRAKIVALRYLGLDVEVDGTGVFVEEVSAEAPVHEQIHQGDVITKLGEVPTLTVDQFRVAMASRHPGEDVTLAVRRAGSGAEETLTTKLFADPSTPEKAILGIYPTTADQQFKFPFDIELDSGDVIGPSSGLAWTLGIIDRLTPGSLTDGRSVAVTGTITPTGEVGAIGGLAQKAVAAQQAGSELMLYPNSQSDEEVQHAKDLTGGRLEMLPVGSLQDAMKILDPNHTAKIN